MRIEYEAREKALKDYNSQMSCAQRCGEIRGENKGIQLARKVFKMYIQGATDKQIAAECHISVQKVREIIN